MTDAQRIPGKFYPLQHDEWLRACRVLRSSERDVLYYIRTLDPYGNGINVSISDIARDLSSEDKIVHRSTVSRALKVLEQQGFINLELLNVRVRVIPRGLHCCAETTMLPPDNNVASRQQARSPRNKRDRHATDVASRQQARSPRNKQEPKPAPDKDSESHKNIKTNKTYKDFLDSLSEGERESFEKFALDKAKALPKPPQLPQKWIAAHFEEIAQEWNKSRGIEPSNDRWANHPKREEWLAKIREMGMGQFCLESGKLDPDRRAFFLWANSAGIIWQEGEQ